MPNVIPIWDIKSAKPSDDVLDIYVYGVIKSDGSFFGNESDTIVSNIIQDLADNPNVKTINMYINSPGGSVNAANALKTRLEAHPATVNSWVDGIAASAASVLMLAASPGCLHMSASAVVMMHLPSTSVDGNAVELAKAVEVLNIYTETLITSYEKRTKMSREKIKALLEATSYLSAEEALALGLVDDITKETEATMSIKGDIVMYGDSCFQISAYAHPEELRSKLETLQVENSLPEGGTSMTIQEYLNALPATTKTMIDAHIAEVVNTAVVAAKAETEEAMNIKITEAEAVVAELTKQAGVVEAKKDEPSVLDSLPEEVKQLIVQAEKKAAEATAKLEEAVQAKALEDFKASLAVYDKLPITDDNVKALFALSNSNPTYFKDIKSLLEVANTAMGANFTSVGTTSGKDVTSQTDAFSIIEAKIADLRKETPTLSYNDAFAQVVTKEPQLYNEYRNQ